MRVAIIGAGFGGLAAGLKLAKSDIDVSIFESEDKPGGLALGFEKDKWSWSLEKHYHHWFTSDLAVRNLAKEVGHDVIFKKVKTSTYIDGVSYQLDSPLSLLRFNKLSIVDRLRTGLVLAYLRVTPYWKPLELITAETFLKRYNGVAAWNVLWKDLFEKKFSKFYNEIPASWFWGRIKKRSSSLGYPKGGFLAFAKRFDEIIHKNKGEVYYKTVVNSVEKHNDKFLLKTTKGEFTFDKVIATLPNALFAKITKGLNENYVQNLLKVKGIGAVNLVLSLKNQFLKDGTYWLNINASHFPFLAIVEHTNFMNKKHYAGEHIVYVGNYLPHEHEYYQKDAVELIREFYPYLKNINPKFDESWINTANLFKAPYAQPIIPLNYSKIVPKMETPINGLYLSNIQQVYPWDRGTNYAVEMGEKVAELVTKSL